MRGDNIESVDWSWSPQSWTRPDPLTVPEPWTWTCGDCGETMARAAINDHVAAHALDPARGVVIGILLGGLLWVLLFALAAVVIARVAR